MNLFEAAAPWNNLDDVPMHLRGAVKRARDARMYADCDIPKVGDLVSSDWGNYKGHPAVVTRIDLPTVYFTYPDGTESSSGIRGIKLLDDKAE